MSLPSTDSDELKQDAEQLAEQLPQSSSKDEALEIAIQAAETAMKALTLAKDPNEKAKLTTRFKQLLAEAEKIKQNKDWSNEVLAPYSPSSNDTSSKSRSTNDRPETLKPPESSRNLSNGEQILLLRASFLHGFKFSPWTKSPALELFELKDGEDMFLYVLLLDWAFQASSILMTPTSAINRIYHFLSFRRMCSKAGNDLSMLCLHRLGFRETGRTWDP